MATQLKDSQLQTDLEASYAVYVLSLGFKSP
jgi:hypothetical protein